MTRPAPARPPRPPLFPWPSELPAIAELAATPHWVCWKYRWRQDRAKDGKWTKPPVDPKTGRYADHGDESTWGTLAVARQRYADDATIDGVGFVVTNDFAVVDLDDCLDATGGIVRPEAREIVEALQSYTEVTPSGVGLRVICRARLPDTLGNRRDEIGVEAYSTKRYVTVSGRHLAGTPTEIGERQPELERIVQKFIGERKARSTPVAAPASTGGLADDDTLLTRLRSADNGGKFRDLWAGETGGYAGDHSAADLALCSLIAFFSQDESQIGRLFERSGLMREKWRRIDYRAATIGKALERADRYRGHRGEDGDAELWAALAQPEQEVPMGVTLATVLEVFQRWLYLPDPGPLIALLGTVAANLMEHETEPTWMLLVGPPSSGKTVLLESLERLDRTFPVSTLTRPSMISGTARKDIEKNSHGGLLMQIGIDQFGLLIIKDFTSLLSQNREVLADTLGALREVYDGHLPRHIGTGGGQTLEWRGKVGIVGGVTEEIDRAHAVKTAMGERFIQYRMPPPASKREKLVFALRNHRGRMKDAKAEMGRVVRALMGEIDWSTVPPPLTEPQEEYLMALAELAASARSAVNRDGYRREIEQIPEDEDPTRLGLALQRVYTGMRLIGVAEEIAWPIVRRMALDSMPTLRRRVLDHLTTTGGACPTDEIANAVGHPTETTRRALEDLAAHGVLVRDTESGKAHRWSLSTLTRRLLAKMEATVSEISEKGRTSMGEDTPLDDPLPYLIEISEKVDRPPVAADPATTERPTCARCGQPATHHYRDPEVWLCLGCAVSAGFVAEDAPPVDEVGGDGEEGEG